jgi:hypothetical protein
MKDLIDIFSSEEYATSNNCSECIYRGSETEMGDYCGTYKCPWIKLLNDPSIKILGDRY